MARRGRKPLPTAIKKLRGSETRYINDNEPRVRPARSLRPPRGMLSDYARKFWNVIIAPLHESGVLKETDLPALELLANSYGWAVQANQDLRREGLYTIDERGLVRKHPAWTIYAQAVQTYSRLAAEFGLTPSSRGSLNLMFEPDEDLGDLTYFLLKEQLRDESN